MAGGETVIPGGRIFKPPGYDGVNAAGGVAASPGHRCAFRAGGVESPPAYRRCRAASHVSFTPTDHRHATASGVALASAHRRPQAGGVAEAPADCAPIPSDGVGHGFAEVRAEPPAASDGRANHAAQYTVSCDAATAAEATNHVRALVSARVAHVPLQGQRVVGRTRQAQIAADGLVGGEGVGGLHLREGAWQESSQRGRIHVGHARAIAA